jgi:hypothetical protein
MYYYFFDESGDGFFTEGVAILCCVVIQNYEETCLKIEELKEDILHAPRFEYILGDFSTTGFHYSDNHFEIRNEFIALLRTLTFQAYICFDPDVTCRDFYVTYDRLFGRLVIDRLRDHRTDEIQICFEQHGRVAPRLEEIKFMISSKVEEIKRVDGREVIYHPTVRCAGKEEPCLAIADYICAIFSTHKAQNIIPGNESLATRNFEDVRMKIRCIHDIKNNDFYSRRNPFP